MQSEVGTTPIRTKKLISPASTTGTGKIVVWQYPRNEAVLCEVNNTLSNILLLRHTRLSGERNNICRIFTPNIPISLFQVI